MAVFVYRGPLAPDSSIFRGRDSEIKRLTQLCQGELQSYAIVFGGRQTGKTSLLIRLATVLPKHIQTCHVDFQGTPGATAPEVYSFLAQRVAQSLNVTNVPHLANAPELTTFLCQIISDTKVGRLVLLMEEWGALSRQSRHDLANVMRSMFSNRYDPSCSQLSKLMIVLAGSIELYELAASEVSTLHNICEPIYLPSLNEADAVGLVTDGLSNLGVDLGTSQMLGEYIYKHVEGHPYLTQRLAGLLEEALGEGQRVNSSHIDRGVEQILTANDPLLHHVHKALVEHNLVSSAQELLVGHLHFSRLDEEMAKLELLGIAREANGYWQVRNSVIARIVKGVLPTNTKNGIGKALAEREKNKMSTITWLHLSDLHFRESQSYNENIVLKALLRDVKQRIQEEGIAPDFIIVSGDIAFSGGSREYAKATQFLDELLSAVALKKDRLFVVPGNHDVDRNAVSTLAAGAVNILTNREFVNSLLSNDFERAIVFRRLNNYQDFGAQYFGEVSPQYFYAKQINISGRRIGILGLNSSWLASSDADQNHLLIGERQVRDALDATQDTDLRIAIMHHPFDWLQGFDRADVEPLLSKYCHFILHGHMHQVGLLQARTPDTQTAVIAAGACYETRQYPNSYNFVRLDLNKGRGKIFLRMYSDRQGGFWTKDVINYENVKDGTYDFQLQNELMSRLPKVVRTFPENGATGVPRRLKTIQIEFDTPMDPVARSIKSELLGMGSWASDYNDQMKSFTFSHDPTLPPLPANTRVSVIINSPEYPTSGFRDLDGNRAATASFTFTTGSEFD